MDENKIWELKDRRVGYESIYKSLSAIQSAMIQAGNVKFKSLEEARADLAKSMAIEFQGFLNINIGDGSSGGEENPIQPQAVEKKWRFFCSECKKGVSEPVKDYSEKYFGSCLCMECQKGLPRNE